MEMKMQTWTHQVQRQVKVWKDNKNLKVIICMLKFIRGSSPKHDCFSWDIYHSPLFFLKRCFPISTPFNFMSISVERVLLKIFLLDSQSYSFWCAKIQNCVKISYFGFIVNFEMLIYSRRLWFQNLLHSVTSNIVLLHERKRWHFLNRSSFCNLLERRVT